MKIHSGWEAPEANRKELMIECMSCGTQSLQAPFIQHCSKCRSMAKNSKYYDMHLLTKRWIAKLELNS